MPCFPRWTNHGARLAINGLVPVGPGIPFMGSDMGLLVTDSRFLTASPYSSWIRSSGHKGLLPFFEEKPWTARCPGLERGPGCP